MVGDRDEIQISALEWDEQNTEHIRRHDVEPEDVEFALTNAPVFFRNLPGRSATHIMVGQDHLGRILYVPLVCVDRPQVWRVITAWESRFARKLFPGGRGEV